MASALNSNSYAFSFPLPGKPDPTQSWDPQVGDHRPRVLQKGQKGETCTYYAYNMLRQRIGKNPPPGFEESRNIEARLSMWRKQRTEITLKYLVEMEFAQGWMSWKNVSREDARQQKKLVSEDLKEGRINALLEGKVAPEKMQQVLDFFASFAGEKDDLDLLSYAKIRLSQREIADARSLLVDLGSDADKAIEKSMQSDGIKAAAQKCCGLVNFSMISLYNLQQSHWHPVQPIQSLIEQIDQHGPHKVDGYFGESYYEAPSFQLRDKIEGRAVFGWKPGTLKKNLEVNSGNHAVVIVGARVIKTAEHVYFVDPNDPSDPAAPLEQRIYVISYKTLKENIVDLMGRHWKLPNGAVSFTQVQKEGNYYAVHG